VFDPAAPSTKRALAELELPGVREHLMKYAVWRARDPDDAKDLIADALVRVCDPDGRPWGEEGSFKRHMRMVMDDIVIQKARRGAGKFEKRMPSMGFGEDRVSDEPPPDVLLHQHRQLDRMRRMGERVHARLVRHDPLGARVYIEGLKGY
jgi:DNA-directed RNA polymerase specialized sigma24 family protein